MAYSEGGQANVKSNPRLPFKESIGNANEKLDRLLTKIYNFDAHLFPHPSEAAAGIQTPESSDFAEMIDRTHSLIDRCELSLDRIRDRF